MYEFIKNVLSIGLQKVDGLRGWQLFSSQIVEALSGLAVRMDGLKKAWQ